MSDTKIVNGAEVTEIEVDPSKTNEQLERDGRRPGRPAPCSDHKYTVAKIKNFRGMEGTGLNAVLFRDGVKVAEVLDEGNGGPVSYDWVDGHYDTPEQTKFLAFIEAERLKIPKDQVTDGFNDHELFNSEIWVWEAVNRVLEDRRDKAACKKKTIFQVAEDIGTDKWRQVKGVSPEIRAWVEKKYAGKKIVFMNDRFKA